MLENIPFLSIFKDEEEFVVGLECFAELNNKWVFYNLKDVFFGNGIFDEILFEDLFFMK